MALKSLANSVRHTYHFDENDLEELIRDKS